MPDGLLSSREARVAGAVIFAANCAICHGVKGDGRGQRREGMNPPPADLTQPSRFEQARATMIYRTIRDGVPRTAMPSWPMLRDQQIWELVGYIHSLQSQ
jgi:high-affinity iron transporter